MRLRLVSISVVLLTALLQTPAFAAQDIHRDARRDVVISREGIAETKPAPRLKSGDIIRIRTVHGLRRVKVHMKFRALTRGSAYLFYYDFDTLRGGGSLGGWTSSDDYQGVWDSWCHRLRHRVSYSKNMVRISLPRTCLENAKTIRVSARISAFMTHHRAGVDWAYSKGDPARSSYGPWVARG